MGWRPPLQVLTGQTIDISILLAFLFWDVVYVSRYDDDKYSGQIGSEKSSEIRGRFVGFAWNVGHALTFKVLTDDSRKIICRSRLRLAKDGENNLKLNKEAGAVPNRVFITSKRDAEGDNVVLPTINALNNPFNQDSIDEMNKNVQLPDHTVFDDKPPMPHSEDSQQYKSPMDDPPLAEEPIVETVDAEEDLPEHLKADSRKPGNPDQEPMPLGWKKGMSMATENPTYDRLSPDELPNRTFLMPPADDGTRV